MNLFKSSPDKQLAAARADVEKLEAKLVDAEQQVIAKRKACEALALEPDAEQRKAEAAYRAAQDHVNITLTPALKTKQELVRDLQAEVDRIADEALRAKTAQDDNQLADEIADSHTAVSATLKHHAELHRRAALVVPEAKGIESFSCSAIGELQPADAVVIRDLRSHARSVLAGGAPASLPQPAPSYVPPQPAPMAAVLSTKPIKWRDAAGDFHISPKWREVSLPIAVADRAVAAGAAVRPGHELWKQKGWGSQNQPALSDCVDLDNDSDAPLDAAKPATVHEPQPEIFHRVDRGPAYPLRVARNESVPATATRDLPKGDT